MDLGEKKIIFVISPHINYYHSYRGDLRGLTDFGKDLKMMRDIIDKCRKNGVELVYPEAMINSKAN